MSETLANAIERAKFMAERKGKRCGVYRDPSLGLVVEPVVPTRKYAVTWPAPAPAAAKKGD